LQATLGPGDPRRPELEQQIDLVAASGQLPPAQPGQDRSVGAPQIQAMVDGLAARLRANADDAAGWVRLVRAYTVLGQTDRRDQALAVARHRYAGRPDILTQLDQAQVAPSPPSATQPSAAQPGAGQPSAGMSSPGGSP
jgi:cytochrome c-type biogenesis protein CcmH